MRNGSVSGIFYLWRLCYNILLTLRYGNVLDNPKRVLYVANVANPTFYYPFIHFILGHYRLILCFHCGNFVNWTNYDKVIWSSGFEVCLNQIFIHFISVNGGVNFVNKAMNTFEKCYHARRQCFVSNRSTLNLTKNAKTWT